MTCPNGHGPLQIAERSGVEIDYCPTCRGVWLDRGELDKIIDRSAPAGQGRRDDDDRHAPRDFSGHGVGHGRPHGKKKESWLGDLFDF